MPSLNPLTGKNPSSRAESREKMLDKIDRLEKPIDIDDCHGHHGWSRTWKAARMCLPSPA